MECREATRLVQLRADHEIAPDECDHLDAHLHQCEPCRAELNASRRVRALLKDAATPSCPDLVRERIERRVRSEQRVPVAPFSAVAVVLLGVVMAGLTFSAGTEDEIVEETVTRHGKNLPPEVGIDKNQVQAFLRQNLRYSIAVPELRHRDRPVRLVGARLSNVRDRDAAYVIYDHRGARLSLFALPSESTPQRDPSGFQRQRVGERDVLVGRRRGYNVVSWKDRDLQYSLVSDVDKSELVELVSSVR